MDFESKITDKPFGNGAAFRNFDIRWIIGGQDDFSEISSADYAEALIPGLLYTSNCLGYIMDPFHNIHVPGALASVVDFRCMSRCQFIPKCRK